MAEDSAQTSSVLSGPALHEAKRALRARMIAAREAIAPATREQASRAIAAALCALPSFTLARCVLLTLPFRSEWNTRTVLDVALASGKVVALPRVNSATRMLDLHRVEGVDLDTRAGYRGIPEPDSRLPLIGIDAIDWVLVPGVAFDPEGRRLGYGGGFYDRLLALLPSQTPRVAGAFDLQVIGHVPAAPHDLTVQQLVTQTRTLTSPAASWTP